MCDLAALKASHRSQPNVFSPFIIVSPGYYSVLCTFFFFSEVEIKIVGGRGIVCMSAPFKEILAPAD